MPAVDMSDLDSYSALERLASDMQKRCHLLLDELEQFRIYLKEQKKESAVDFSRLKSEAEYELKRVKTLPMDNVTRSTQLLSTSNLPFFEALWSAAKLSSGVTAIGAPGSKGIVHRVNGQWGLSRRSGCSLTSAEAIASVDIIAENNSEYIKVSTITEKRILFDLAKSGWVEGQSSDDSDNEDPKDDPSPEGLLKIADNLVKAARSTRIQYRHPTTRLVLPRIRRTECHKEVTGVLQRIRDLGITVQTSEDIPEDTILLSQVLQEMVPNEFVNFSETLNIDTTILLAFASDLSHDSVEPKDWHNKLIAHQIIMEKQGPLLPNKLWPVCGARRLVCTREAADRMLEIVEIIGSETEKRRASLLLNVDGGTSSLTSREQRVEGFQLLSKYEVPLDWKLPIEVVDVDFASIKSSLPSVSGEVAKVLIPMNLSIFFYGWKSGYTTISANGAVANEIQKIIEDNCLDEDDFTGPDVWICKASRALVGNERKRTGADLVVS